MITFGMEFVTYFSTMLYYSILSNNKIDSDGWIIIFIIVAAFSSFPQIGLLILVYHILKQNKHISYIISGIILISFSLFVHTHYIMMIYSIGQIL
jgi:hypothetical protein